MSNKFNIFRSIFCNLYHWCSVCTRLVHISIWIFGVIIEVWEFYIYSCYKILSCAFWKYFLPVYNLSFFIPLGMSFKTQIFWFWKCLIYRFLKFVENTILSPPNCICTLVKMTMCVGLCLEPLFYCIGVCIPLYTGATRLTNVAS